MSKDEGKEIQNLENEEFVTLDDNEIDELFEDIPIANVQQEKSPKANKTLLKLLLLLLFVIVAVAFTLYYIYSKKQEELKDINQTKELINNIQNASSKEKTDDKNLTYEQSVSKEIDRLFKEGKKKEALELREKLALFNNALSHYNLGVAKLKSKDFDSAKKEFLLSSSSQKIRFESILNLAVIGYYQNDEQSFSRYLHIARKLLPAKRRSPLYSYYRFLIDYYGGFFAEALVPLHNQSSSYFHEKKLYANIKISTLLHNFNEAITLAQKSDDPKYTFALGLLYAKMGDLELSSKYLNKSIKEGNFILESKTALSLVDIKMGLFNKSAKILKSANDINESRATKLYPINVVLKESLFDPVYAQKEFQNRLFMDDLTRISILFHFAPYMISDPKLSSFNIQKGAKNIFINNFIPASISLSKSKNLSSANQYAIMGIKESLKGSLLKAEDIFLKSTKLYPNSSELHYDLALTYAKMYQFKKAQKEFAKSAVLDRNNLLSQTFSYFCDKLLHRSTKDRLSKLKEKFTKSNNSDTVIKRALALLSISSKIFDDSKFDSSDTIFDKAILLIRSSLLGDNKNYKKIAKLIQKDAPRDIVANILEIDASWHNKDIKEYAKAIQKRFIDNSIDNDNLISNASLPRELYTKILSIAGFIHKLRDSIEKNLKENPKNIGLLQSLAYTDIYLKNFEESYKIYNHLIDDLKQDDSHTLLLGAIASIGSNHHANAIALLELSKLENRSDFESRVALGLLYLEHRNFEAASIEFQKIGDNGFKSQYFDFYIKE